tara:strand:- start:1707 stop:2072 length:366 start_codon:yes stop_codon:yes gene_type:complete
MNSTFERSMKVYERRREVECQRWSMDNAGWGWPKIINWIRCVRVYKEKYGDNEEHIEEFLRKLVPVRIEEMEEEYTGPLGIRVEKDEVGLSLSNIIQNRIFDNYLHQFMKEWNPICNKCGR